MQNTTPRMNENAIEASLWDMPGWDAPTLRELADRVEHQFGSLPALSGLETLGLGRDEALAPCDVHMVCDLLGVPAADFGLDV